MTNLTKELSCLSGVSGHEQEVRTVICQRLKNASAVQDIRVDRLGNCIVSLKGKKRAPKTVVLAAHMDEVGGIVTGITEEGYLRFTAVGGISDDVLFARRVAINGHVGVIGGKAIHQCKGDAKTTVPSVSNMLVDIGAQNEEQARTVANEGDVFTFCDEQLSLANGYFASKALDDRVGCALLLKLAQTEPEYDVTLVFTVQEEIGTRGAMVAAFSIQPEITVVVDATTAADVAGVPIENQVCQTKKGAVVSYMDRGTLYDSNLYHYICKLAASFGIAAQTKTTVAGGNDASAFQKAGAGSRVAAVSLPCRYIHSPLCILNEFDIQSTYLLLEKLMNTLPAWEETL